MKDRANQSSEDISDDYIKWCLSLTPQKRLECLEKLNEFLFKAMPAENKEIAKKLREEGL